MARAYAASPFDAEHANVRIPLELRQSLRHTEAMTQTVMTFTGIDITELDRVLETGIDHGGNPVEPYLDEKGGWPVRCCLGYTDVGDHIALIAWSPFAKRGAYAETGPIFVHTHGCSGPSTNDTLPDELNQRAMVMRPYTHDQRIAYHHVRHVAAGESLADIARELLAEDDVDFVHGRNVTGGCYAFEARRV